MCAHACVCVCKLCFHLSEGRVLPPTHRSSKGQAVNNWPNYMFWSLKPHFPCILLWSYQVMFNGNVGWPNLFFQHCWPDNLKINFQTSSSPMATYKLAESIKLWVTTTGRVRKQKGDIWIQELDPTFDDTSCSSKGEIKTGVEIILLLLWPRDVRVGETSHVLEYRTTQHPYDYFCLWW